MNDQSSSWGLRVADSSAKINVIQPHGGLLDLRLGEVWEYRDLVVLLVRRDFVAQYKQTVLGPAWHVIQPIFTTLVFTLVFGTIAQIPTEGAPPFLFYMAGTTVWTYFSNVLTATANTFISNAGIFGKVYFPRLVMPVATLFSRLIAFAIQLSFFVALVLWYWFARDAVHPNISIALLPVLLMMLAAFSLALGIIVSALTIRYRDLAVIVGFGVQLYMYVSPIVYPISALSPKWQKIAMLNPVAPILEAMRHGFLGVGMLDLQALAVSAATILVVLVIGIILFNRVERTFMDSV